MRRLVGAAAALALALTLIVPAANAEFTVNGFVLLQYGMFVSNYHNNQGRDPDSVQVRSFPTDHGDLGGSLSIARNVLQLEADWWPHDVVRLRGIFRGAYHAELKGDRYAQIPGFDAPRSYNNNDKIKRRNMRYVRDNYYNEAEIRELYLDIYASDRLSFRVGRQQVAWGSTGTARLLDVVNPINASWHFASFENFEDVRVPLWMIKVLYDIPALDGSIEAIWIPAIEPDPSDLVTLPLTFVGAWGLPIAPLNEFDSTLTITKKVFKLPRRDLKDSRVGVRWNGNLGGVNYTLVYYWTHLVSPPIPVSAQQEIALNDAGLHDTEIFLDFPRQSIFGLSLEYSFQSPVSSVLKFEASCEPDRVFPLNSNLGPGATLDRNKSVGWTLMDDREGWQQAPFPEVRRTTVNYALVWQRTNQFRWLNPKSSVITQFQIFQSFIFDKRSLKDDDEWFGHFRLGKSNVEEKFDSAGHTKINPRWWIVDIPGYDTTIRDPYSTLLVFAILSDYFQGRLRPIIIQAYLPSYLPDDSVAHNYRFFAAIGEAFKKGSGFTSVRLQILWDNYWRVELGTNLIYGYNPYKSLGLFRDRDEVYVKLKYQF